MSNKKKFSKAKAKKAKHIDIATEAIFDFFVLYPPGDPQENIWDLYLNSLYSPVMDTINGIDRVKQANFYKKLFRTTPAT